MKRSNFGWIILSLANTAVVLAQPPAQRGDGPRGEGPRGERPRAEEGRGEGPGQGVGRPPLPIVDAIDKNHDHVLSAEEIKAATAALMTLDKNGDGQLTEEEYLPMRRDGGPQERGPQERGPQDRAPRENAAIQDREPRDRGPQDGRPQERGPQERAPQDRGPDGPPPPSPERFVEHAMQFDADGDGKLDRNELMKFAEQMPNHRPGDMPQPERRREGDRPGAQAGRGDRPNRPDSE